jgi:hypothetical protein
MPKQKMKPKPAKPTKSKKPVKTMSKPDLIEYEKFPGMRQPTFVQRDRFTGLSIPIFI